MRVEQIQAFLAVVETQSFQQAALACGLTQSTISRQVQALEQALGYPLVHRTGGISLTQAGQAFLPHAQRICQEWQSAQTAVRSRMGGQQTELCIAAIHSVCAHLLPQVLQQFRYDFPQIQLRVTALGSDRALKVLRDGLVDIALVMDNPLLTRSGALTVQPLYREPIHVVMAHNHPLAGRPAVDWADLATYPQAVFKDGYGMRNLLVNHMSRLGLNLDAALELNTLDAFRGVVRQGYLIALLPALALEEMATDATLCICPTTAPLLERQVVLVSSSDRQQIPPIAHFLHLAGCLTPSLVGRDSLAWAGP
ncbi:MAG: LysR family transcriptional regulator [Gloeomargaritaceae cyanobacterium C42_A2020_066]|nr:LysR family transcriptional regulator [Gloeomargaritaceae cyanobacterium C42_A2020_066]